MAEAHGHVEGIHNDHQVTLYALSTCIWCRKTREFLEAEGIAFDYVYLDLLEGDELEAAREQVRTWNSRVSFPTLVIDDKVCIVGAKTDDIKEALGL